MHSICCAFPKLDRRRPRLKTADNLSWDSFIWPIRVEIAGMYPFLCPAVCCGSSCLSHFQITPNKKNRSVVRNPTARWFSDRLPAITYHFLAIPYYFPAVPYHFPAAASSASTTALKTLIFIFPTLAPKLAHEYPTFQTILVLQLDPDIARASPYDRMGKTTVEPLRSAGSRRSA